MTEVGKWNAGEIPRESVLSIPRVTSLHVSTDSTARLIARFAFRGNNYQGMYRARPQHRHIVDVITRYVVSVLSFFLTRKYNHQKKSNT